MQNFYLLKDEALLEIYTFIDENIRKLPKKSDGSFDEGDSEFINNNVDAFRHAYVSGVYTMEYSEKVADILGRLNELFNIASGDDRINEENMDLWNNAVGRQYGKEAKSRKELFELLLKALKNGEFILNPNDKRKYKGPKSIRRRPKSLVIVIEESETGENLSFYDIDAKKEFLKEQFVALIESGFYPNYSVKRIHGKKTPVSKSDRFNFNNLG